MATIDNLWLPQSEYSDSGEFALHKVVWSNEVQTARLNSLFMPRLVMNKTPMFQGGGATNKEVDFIVTGRIGSERHNRGDIITGTGRSTLKRTVKLDDRPYRTAVEDEYITRMFEQTDVRRGLFDSMGFALAARQEVEVLKMVGAAARVSTPNDSTNEFLRGGNYYHSGDNTGGINVGASAGATRAKAILSAIKSVSIKWGEQNVQYSQRWCVVPLADFYNIRECEEVYPDSGSATIAGGIYGNVDIAGPKRPFSQFLNPGQPLEYMGVKIIAHNLLEATYSPEVKALKYDWSAITATGAEGDRNLNFSDTLGFIFQSEAVGYADVMKTGLNVYRPGNTTNELVWAADWMGGGTLRPECAVELNAA